MCYTSNFSLPIQRFFFSPIDFDYFDLFDLNNNSEKRFSHLLIECQNNTCSFSFSSSSQDKCVCEEDTCWKHQCSDRYWLIRERWAVSLISTPLRNSSRRTAKYLENKIYSNDDHLIDKGFRYMKRRTIINDCELNQMCIYKERETFLKFLTQTNRWW